MSGRNSDDLIVVDNEAEGRFEARIGDDVAVNRYRIDGDTITFFETLVPEGLRGHGIGQKLARAGLDAARERGLNVVPECPFIASYVREHDEYADLLAQAT